MLMWIFRNQAIQTVDICFLQPVVVSSVAMWSWLPFTGCISAVIFINRRTIWAENSSDYFLTFCILTKRVELNLVIINWHDCKTSSMQDKIIRLAISFLKFKQLVCYVTETKNIAKLASTSKQFPRSTINIFSLPQYSIGNIYFGSYWNLYGIIH